MTLQITLGIVTLLAFIIFGYFLTERRERRHAITVLNETYRAHDELVNELRHIDVLIAGYPTITRVDANRYTNIAKAFNIANNSLKAKQPRKENRT